MIECSTIPHIIGAPQIGGNFLIAGNNLIYQYQLKSGLIQLFHRFAIILINFVILFRISAKKGLWHAVQRLKELLCEQLL